MAFTSTNPNTRVYYATQAVAIGNIGSTSVVDSPDVVNTGHVTSNLMIAHGLQSCQVTTNFNLDPIFELGQLSLYENYEEVPEIEVSFEKVLDGYALMYHMGTASATTPTLAGRSEARADVRLLIGLTTMEQMATGSLSSGVAEMYCSGMYVSSVSYSLSTDGNFTESTSFVGNDKNWYSGTGEQGVLTNTGDAGLISAFASSVFGSDAPVGDGTVASVQRRQNVVVGAAGATLGGTTYRTLVPNFVEGGTAATGTNETNAKYINEVSAGGGGPFITSFSASVDLGREQINALGKRGPYTRYVNFPVEVTCDLEMLAIGGDNVDAAEEGGANGKNLSDHSMQFVLDDSTVICLGSKNKLTSVSYGGGDAGGGNTTITYSMTNYNDFIILQSGDPAGITLGNYWQNYL